MAPIAQQAMAVARQVPTLAALAAVSIPTGAVVVVAALHLLVLVAPGLTAASEAHQLRVRQRRQTPGAVAVALAQRQHRALVVRVVVGICWLSGWRNDNKGA